MSRAFTDLGQRIVALRVRRGLTQRELAEAAQISVPFLSGVENGKRNVSSEVILRIADALDASLDYLLRGVEDEPSSSDPGPVPPALHSVAGRLGWSYGNVQSVLRAYRSVMATRGGAGRDWSEDDWLRLYSQFFDG